MDIASIYMHLIPELIVYIFLPQMIYTFVIYHGHHDNSASDTRSPRSSIFRIRSSQNLQRASLLMLPSFQRSYPSLEAQLSSSIFTPSHNRAPTISITSTTTGISHRAGSASGGESWMIYQSLLQFHRPCMLLSRELTLLKSLATTLPWSLLLSHLPCWLTVTRTAKASQSKLPSLETNIGSSQFLKILTIQYVQYALVGVKGWKIHDTCIVM